MSGVCRGRQMENDMLEPKNEGAETDAEVKGLEAEAPKIGETAEEIADETTVGTEAIEKHAAEKDSAAAAETAEGIEAVTDGEAEDVTAETGEEDGELEEETPEERGRRKRKEIIGDLIFFVVSFVVIFTIFKIFPPYRVSGDSMNMTLKDKAFGFGTIYFTPDYGDIVVLHGDQNKTNDSDFIKRIVGKPGDVLEITDGVVVRNGKQITESYAYYDPEYTYKTGMTQRIVLGDGEYLVLGDNRYHSMDGRYFGAIKRSEMKCKMLFFLWGKKR